MKTTDKGTRERLPRSSDADSLAMTERMGKIPPHSKELEDNVIGGIIIDNSLMDVVGSILQPKHFYQNPNSLIYKAILKMTAEKIPIDLTSLTHELQISGDIDPVGGPYTLADLSTCYTSAETVEYSAKKILEYWVKRDLIKFAYSLQEMAFDPTVEAGEMLNTAQKELFETAAITQKNDYIVLKDVVNSTIEYGERISTAGGKAEIRSVFSGYNGLDKITGGFHPAELIIIAGRPGDGKTALALSIARNSAVDYKKNIGFFSIEMSHKELAMRMVCSEGKVDIQKFKTGNLQQDDFESLARNMENMKKFNIMIDDTAPLGVFELSSKARRWKKEYDIDMVIVDYLQLMEIDYKGLTRNMDRHLEIAYITRSLKSLSKELDIPVVALSQLSRKVEDRAGDVQRPQLSDLRESGAIEQDADVVIFVIRPEAHMKKDSIKFDEWRGKALIDVAKQRNGPVGETMLAFIHKFARFENYTGQKPSLQEDMREW